MVVVVVAAITLIVVVAVVVVGYIRVSSRLKFLNVYIGHISSLNTFINVPFKQLSQSSSGNVRAAQIVGLSRHMTSLRIIFSESVF